ncbi:CwfJ C-terminus 1-domain-containing protein-like protein [Peziza echinospora]|nr:CwfJ C-terminus 1-domain-containing protein-like protein [Peziza echinospora]
MPAKILVIGALNGSLSQFLPKLSALHSKQQFTLAICVGDVFSSNSSAEEEEEFLQQLVRGEHTIPLPIYFSVGRARMPAVVEEKLKKGGGAGEVCENLFWLGRKGVLSTSEGVRIVVLAGEEGKKEKGGEDGEGEGGQVVGEFEPRYTAEEASVLRGVNAADVLVTWEWPEGVQGGGSRVALPGGGARKGSVAVRELARRVRPRYHFVAWGGGGAGEGKEEEADGGGEAQGFWEREPFRNEWLPKEREREASGAGGVKAPGVTRFIALGAWGNKEKAKALYAFNLPLLSETSAAAALPEIPPNTTESPYLSSSSSSGDAEGRRGKKRGATPEPGGSGTFFWGDAANPHANAYDGGRGGGGRGKRGRGGGHGGGGGGQRRPPPGPDSCFFCLSNPTIEKHLLLSIGNDSYLATAKGPLPLPSSSSASSKSPLPFPAHILIIPLPHTPTLHTISPPQTRKDTYAEMTRYRHALGAMLRERGYGNVCWEVARGRGGVHTHWQVCPFDAGRWSVEDVEGRFLEAGRRALGGGGGGGGGAGEEEEEGKAVVGFVRREVGVEEFDNPGEEVPAEAGNYFRVWVTGPLGEKKNKKDPPASSSSSFGDKGSLVLELEHGAYFDLQFGRRVMAALLFGDEEGEARGLGIKRADWRECVQSKEEEARDARMAKEAFRKWDFTL